MCNAITRLLLAFQLVPASALGLFRHVQTGLVTPVPVMLGLGACRELGAVSPLQTVGGQIQKQLWKKAGSYQE